MSNREITSATVTVTIELNDLGVFVAGSSYDQTKEAAKQRLIRLGIEESSITNMLIRAIAVSPAKECRQRLAAEGKPYPRSSCAACGKFSPKWRECDAEIQAEARQQ